MPADRVAVEDHRLTAACPECDSSNVWFRRETGTPLNDASTAFRCSDCAAAFDEAIVRPFHDRAGNNAKYADLSPEDVGL